MTDKAIDRVSIVLGQVIIYCEDGSILWVTVGSKGADVTYAPDNFHYPEPMVTDDKGRERYPTDFTRVYD